MMAMDKMTMDRNLIISIAALIVIALGGYMLYQSIAAQNANKTEFSSTEHAVAFAYPEHYILNERDEGERHTITLLEQAPDPNASEGPPAITVDIFPNTEGLTASDWVERTPASNFQLSPDGTLASSTVGGSEAVAYVWDGLYRGESYVFTHENRIYMLSVTYLDADDQIREDFTELLQSLRFL